MPSADGRRFEAELVVAVSVGLAVIFALLAATQFRFFGDTEHYVTMARDIATGEAIRSGSWRTGPYPPGAGLLLAPAALLFHGSFAAISRWAAILASLVFPLTWMYVKRRNRSWAWAIAILTVGSMPFLDLATGNPMSDVLSLAITLALLIWADAWERDGEKGRHSVASTVTGCILLVALPAMRSSGIVAIGAAGLALGARILSREPGKRPLRLGDAIPFLVGFAATLIWYAGVYRGRGYMQFFLLANPMQFDLGRASLTQLLLRPVTGVVSELHHAIELMTPGLPVRLTWFTPALLAVPLILVGWWRELRSSGRFAALYFAGYFVVLLFWPYDIGPRYLLGVVPLLWLFLFGGVEETIRAIRADRKGLRTGGLVAAAVAITGLLLHRAGVLPGWYRVQDAASLIAWSILAVVLVVGWGPLVRLARRVHDRQVRGIVTVGAVGFAALSMVRIGPNIVQRANGTLPLWGAEGMAIASGWIRANLSPDALILTSSPSQLTFATGRPALRLPRTSAPQEYLALERAQPKYLLIIEHDSSWSMPNDDMKLAILQKVFPDRWRLVQHFPGASLYSFEPKP